MIKKINQTRNLAMSLVVTLALLSFVSAVAVGGQYSTDYPLKMYPGQVQQVAFGLQNLAGVDDLKFSASVESGSEVVSLFDDSNEYFLPSGTANQPVNVEIRIPDDAEIGSKYNVQIKFSPMIIGDEETGATGAVLSSGLSKYFIVEVIEKPAEAEVEGISTIWWVLGAVVLILAILVIWFVVKSRKEQTEIISNK